MLRTWNKIHFHALLAACLAASPALGQDKKDAEGIDAIKAKLDSMELALKKANEKLDALKDLHKQVDDLKSECNLSLGATQRDLRSLNNEVGRLRDVMEKLRNSGPVATRIAASPPTDTHLAPTGQVELVNTYTQDVSIVVNNRTYRLHPNEKRLTDPLPAGSFTYEVLGVTPPNTRSLNPNEIYHITVHPQL